LNAVVMNPPLRASRPVVSQAEAMSKSLKSILLASIVVFYSMSWTTYFETSMVARRTPRMYCLSEVYAPMMSSRRSKFSKTFSRSGG
jgi:hypothetical protein